MSPAHQRVLVLGATGMLGHRAVPAFGEAGFEVHASVRNRQRAERHGIEGVVLHDLDAADPDGPAHLLDEVRPAAVVNCVGLVKQLEEASHPLPAIEINALFPHRVAAACEEVGARLVHVSTDCVFSGRLDPPAAYTEQHEPDPDDLYGHSKLLGEVSGEHALTLRTSMIGWELERASGLLEWFASQPGPEVGGFTNAIFSGLSTDAFAEVLVQIVRDHHDLAGLYNVAAEPISKYDLLVRLNEALGVDHEIVPREEPRINRALDPARLADETGIAAPSWDEMVAGLAATARRELPPP